ncbi:MAG: L,D-transpeptidase family protein [Prevotella sp.]|nr:L,D-transpeptidase family protein [Prevotella sp.]
MEAFSDMKTPAFVLDSHQVDVCLKKMMKADGGNTRADKQTRSYYKEADYALLWVDGMGVDERADSLLAWLHLLNEIGMSEQAFGVGEIEQDLKRIRTLDLDEGKNSMSQVAARLDYRLTKACLRYCYGQRFGFINPYHVFNNLDAEKTDSVKGVIKYSGLFDMKMDMPDKDYAAKVFGKIRNDSIAAYLREIQPKDRFYGQLRMMLASAPTADQRKRIMVNMERCRWRSHQPMVETGKRIIVNIPAYHLYAYSDEDQLDMRVVCGNKKTKTPLLSSYIEWMEINPQWVIPMSIIENDVARRAGDSSYFARNRYHIYERATNKKMPIHSVTKQMLLSGKYRVAQEGGAGNSLGRIVFRFKNNFSVFLHDTSNPGAFERQSRDVSHGCVRVSKPFDLAQFVLDDPDEWLVDRIRIAMGIPAETVRGIDYERDHPETEGRNKLIGYVPVKPRVPLYIIYYTLWPDVSGMLQTWPDVYGYDEVVWDNLKPYL